MLADPGVHRDRRCRRGVDRPRRPELGDREGPVAGGPGRLGEPRALLEATIRIDGATINVYATHLTSWGRLNSKIRAEQLSCLAREVRTSRYPYILAGDFNTGPDSPEMQAFRRENAAQLASQEIGATFPHWNEQIDYIFADHGWQVRTSRAWPVKVSDHLPVTAELMWRR